MINRHNLMTSAHNIRRALGLTMAHALHYAWTVAKMHLAPVAFTFRKVDGTIRRAVGTLASAYLPATGGNRRECPGVQVYFDLEKGEWRSFRIANLV